MNRLQFTYCVIRYTPDAGAGEMLNVGVLLYASATDELQWRFDTQYERLSAAFAGFNGKSYRESISRMQSVLRDAMGETTPILKSDRRFASAQAWLRHLISDEGLSFRVGDQLGGVTTDLRREAAMLFERMVTSRRNQKAESARASNEEVWKNVYEPALPQDVVNSLEPKVFHTDDVDLRFEHAYKSGAWHVVQPVSLDARRPETIRNRASVWAGTTLGLQGTRELAHIYFLLGAPTDPSLIKAYEKAKRLLDKSPVPHAIVEEQDAEQFAEEFTRMVRHNGR